MESNEKTIKVSFDFDSTLDRESVQKYAKELIDQGIEVYITTSRHSDKEYDYAQDWNDDLYEVADKLGIPRKRIRFTDMVDKYKFFEEGNFLWHLDDDWVENRLINKNTKTKAISHIGSGNWIGKCNRIIKKLGGNPARVGNA